MSTAGHRPGLMISMTIGPAASRDLHQIIGPPRKVSQRSVVGCVVVNAEPFHPTAISSSRNVACPLLLQVSNG
jgi:hypothetical protein